MIRRPPRSTQSRSSAASDVYKRQVHGEEAQIVEDEGNLKRNRKKTEAFAQIEELLKKMKQRKSRSKKAEASSKKQKQKQNLKNNKNLQKYDQKQTQKIKKLNAPQLKSQDSITSEKNSLNSESTNDNFDSQDESHPHEFLLNRQRNTNKFGSYTSLFKQNLSAKEPKKGKQAAKKRGRKPKNLTNKENTSQVQNLSKRYNGQLQVAEAELNTVKTQSKRGRKKKLHIQVEV
eukprot:TRINITY_DN5298_c0_g4_i2.p1 TRINITY_DN5298_c0_g4~~TRINITY_DN5298_c0_g4_i2.p1  ORF type:complete len:232 (+),score=67.93 TRINITY_DN5298_c0_g4_i2:21-716(+)